VAESDALQNLEPGLKAVDNVLSFVKSGAGKPSAKERSLFVASIALSYAVWENFAEDLAMEAVTFLAQEIDPADVPDAAKTFIEQGTTPWELAVHPGWRELWVSRVRGRSKGRDDRDEDFGLLTANVKKVRGLFAHMGLDPFADIEADRLVALDDLVSLRGTIVHTGRPPADFVKSDATGSRDLVKDLAEEADKAVASQIESLTKSKPW
jgi:hypothetical protein